MSRLVCLLGGLLVLWLPEPASAEDGEGGAVRLEVGLISEQPLPIDVAGALWPALNVEVVCSDRSIAASSIEVSEQKERPSRRLVTARGLPPGKCTLAFTVHEASKEVVVPVRDGRVTRGEVMVEVAWSRFTLERLLDGDAAWLVPEGAPEGSDGFSVSAEPTVVPPGSYTLQLEHLGSRFDITSVVLGTGDKRAEAYGTLEISSRVLVERMKVVLDGGKRRPAREQMVLPARSWKVGLEAPGRRSAERTIQVKAGATARWTRSLSRARPAAVTIEVGGPESFTFFIDGEETEPKARMSVPTGKHKFTVKSPGWKTEVQRIELEESQRVTLQFVMKLAEVPIVVEPLPEGATVTVRSADGEASELEVEGERARGSFAPGTWTLQVTAPDRVPFEKQLVLEVGGEKQTIAPELPSAFVKVRWVGLIGSATLTVQSEGAEAKQLTIRSDGTAGARLPAVPATWRVEAQGRLPVEGVLELSPGGENQEVAVELVWDPAFQGTLRTVILAGSAGGLAVVGGVLLGAAGGSFAAANQHHDDYLNFTVPGEIVEAKLARDAAAASGEGEAAAGLILLGAAAGTGAACLIQALLGKKKTPEAAALVLPLEGGVAFGLAGRW